MIVLEKVRRRLYRTRVFQKLGLPAPALRQPLFLVGTVRSGTTYFARCVADHPQVINAGFELSREWHELAGIEIATPGLPCVHCPPAGPEAVAGRVEEVREGFARLHSAKGGWSGTRLFNKSPHLWNKLPLIRALFPDAVLLVTSRDLRSTVASTKRLWEKMEKDWGVKHYLPEDPEACWSVQGPDPDRLFPGGDAAVLAEYWLRVYETIDREAAAFRTVLPVRHQAFVDDPLGVLRNVEREAGLRPSDYPRLAEMQSDRNRRWPQILTAEEQRSVSRFLDTHGDRIARLRFAETEVA
ncbi:MAG TPA: sulfotransferase [Thermoanaerobaculia bacterium]|nr:sulfotransferase [Thermoanaerobaculia bacterium]